MSQLLRHLKKYPNLLVGGFMTILLILVALLAPWISQHHPFEKNLLASLRPPVFLGGDLLHPLGTDILGHDILSRIFYGARASISIAFLTVTLALIIGVSLAIISTYLGGGLGIAIQRLADIWQAVPYPILALAASALLGKNQLNIILILGLTTWILFYRVVRSQVFSIKESDYIQAAKALGANHQRVFWYHIAPNTLPVILVMATTLSSQIIIFEASLSFLGLGLSAEIVSWGTMVAEGRGYESTFWWVPIFPSLAIAYTAIAINLLGDGLREIFDKRIS